MTLIQRCRREGVTANRTIINYWSIEKYKVHYSPRWNIHIAIWHGGPNYWPELLSPTPSALAIAPGTHPLSQEPRLVLSSAATLRAAIGCRHMHGCRPRARHSLRTAQSLSSDAVAPPALDTASTVRTSTDRKSSPQHAMFGAVAAVPRRRRGQAFRSGCLYKFTLTVSERLGPEDATREGIY